MSTSKGNDFKQFTDSEMASVVVASRILNEEIINNLIKRYGSAYLRFVPAISREGENGVRIGLLPKKGKDYPYTFYGFRIREYHKNKEYWEGVRSLAAYLYKVTKRNKIEGFQFLTMNYYFYSANFLSDYGDEIHGEDYAICVLYIKEELTGSLEDFFTFNEAVMMTGASMKNVLTIGHAWEDAIYHFHLEEKPGN